MAPVEIGSPEWLHNRDVLMAEQATEIAKMGWAAVGVFPKGHARQVRMAEEGDTLPILAGNDWRPTVRA